MALQLAAGLLDSDVRAGNWADDDLEDVDFDKVERELSAIVAVLYARYQKMARDD